MTRTVITGGAGFLGSHLCDSLLARGHEVVAVDSFVTGRKVNIEHLLDHEGFTLIEHDVSESLPVEGPIDQILHFASPASPPGYLARPLITLKAGSFATHHALELAEANGARFLLASTSEVYGDPLVHPQPESYWGNVNPNGPRSVYDEAKRYAEAATMSYAREFGTDVRILRIFNTYGPRMDPEDGRVVSNFIVQALRGQPLTVYGDGNQTRSFCFVADEVAGILALLDGSVTGPINIGNDTEFTMLELAHLVLEITGSSSDLVFEPLPENDPLQRRPDLTAARRDLGWSPTTQLRDGLEQTVPYFRSAIGLG